MNSTVPLASLCRMVGNTLARKSYKIIQGDEAAEIWRSFLGENLPPVNDHVTLSIRQNLTIEPDGNTPLVKVQRNRKLLSVSTRGRSKSVELVRFYDDERLLSLVDSTRRRTQIHTLYGDGAVQQDTLQNYPCEKTRTMEGLVAVAIWETIEGIADKALPAANHVIDPNLLRTNRGRFVRADIRRTRSQRNASYPSRRNMQAGHDPQP